MSRDGDYSFVFLLAIGIPLLIFVLLIKFGDGEFRDGELGSVEKLNIAITEHFGSENWILDDVKDTYFGKSYVVNTESGRYSIMLNEDGTKVQKAFKDGVLSE